MQALIIMAHGSRRLESNQEVEALAVRLLKNSKFDLVSAAFLELAGPSLPDQIEHMVEAGADTITIFPFFLAPGTHVSRDIPELVRGAETVYPQVKIRLAEHLGAIPGLDELILNSL